MSPAHARRSGEAWHRVLPARSGTRLLQVLAVVGLIVGVVGMHSLGLGHGPMTGEHSISAAHSTSAGATQMAEMGELPTLSAPSATASLMAQAVAGVDPGHGMAAMCLAVLPFLVLLVARMLGFRVRGLGPVTYLLSGGRNVRDDRAPPAYRCPSLLKLCILRT